MNGQCVLYYQRCNRIEPHISFCLVLLSLSLPLKKKYHDIDYSRNAPQHAEVSSISFAPTPSTPNTMVQSKLS